MYFRLEPNAPPFGLRKIVWCRLVNNLTGPFLPWIYVRACIHAYIHACMHAYIHIYIYMCYVCIYLQAPLEKVLNYPNLAKATSQEVSGSLGIYSTCNYTFIYGVVDNDDANRSKYMFICTPTHTHICIYIYIIHNLENNQVMMGIFAVCSRYLEGLG